MLTVIYCKFFLHTSLYLTVIASHAQTHTHSYMYTYIHTHLHMLTYCLVLH